MRIWHLNCFLWIILEKISWLWFSDRFDNILNKWFSQDIKSRRLTLFNNLVKTFDFQSSFASAPGSLPIRRSWDLLTLRMHLQLMILLSTSNSSKHFILSMNDLFSFSTISRNPCLSPAAIYFLMFSSKRLSCS